MNQQHFTNPELSKKLEQLGVVSQFDYWWYQNVIPIEKSGKAHTYESEYSFTDNHKAYFFRPKMSNIDCGDFTQAYHFSDLLLPHNIKLWNRYYTEENKPNLIPIGSYLMDLVFNEQDWQTWLEAEVDQALANKKQ